MRTFEEYNRHNAQALLTWMAENFNQISQNKFQRINGDKNFSKKEIITQAAMENIVAWQWATLEISRLSLLQ